MTTIGTIAAEQDRRYYAITIKPQVFVNLVPDHVIFHRMYPLAVDRTIVECDWLFLPGVVASGTDLTHSVELFDRVNRQDFEGLRALPAVDVVPGVRARGCSSSRVSTTSAPSTSG